MGNEMCTPTKCDPGFSGCCGPSSSMQIVKGGAADPRTHL